MTLVEPRWDDARAALAAAVRPLAPVRHVLAVCDGLVLAEDLVALCALPSFDTSAMDGWAVAGPGPWTVVGQSLAGRPVPGPLTPGQAVVIATGGVVPQGADARGPQRGRRGPGAWWGRGAQRTDARTGPRTSARRVRSAPRVRCWRRPGRCSTPALIGLAAAAGHDELAGGSRPSGGAGAVRRRAGHGRRPGPRAGARLARPAGARVGGSHGCGRRARGALRGHARRPRRGDPSRGRGRRCGADHRGDGGGTGRPSARGDRPVRGRGGHRQRRRAPRTPDAGGHAGSRSRLAGRAPGEPAERDRDPDEPGRADPGRVGRSARVAGAGRRHHAPRRWVRRRTRTGWSWVASSRGSSSRAAIWAPGCCAGWRQPAGSGSCPPVGWPPGLPSAGCRCPDRISWASPRPAWRRSAT